MKTLLSLQAKTARVVRGGQELELPTDEVLVGDVIAVRPGEKIPVDHSMMSAQPDESSRKSFVQPSTPTPPMESV